MQLTSEEQEALRQELLVMCEESAIDCRLVDRLHALLSEPPAGTVSEEEIASAVQHREHPQLALLCAIVAATAFRAHVDLLRDLLAWLADNEERLTLYDRGRYWHLRGFTAWRLDDDWLATCRSLYRSIALLGGLGDERRHSYLGRVWNSFAQFMHHQGRFRESRFAFEKALVYRQSAADEAERGFTLGNLARVCMDFGDFQAARNYLLEDLEIVRRTDATPVSVEIQLLSELGQCALKQDDTAAAEDFYRQSAGLAEREEWPAGKVFAAVGLGRVALATDRVVEAKASLRRAREEMQAAELPEPLASELKAIAWLLDAEIEHASGNWTASIAAFEAARDFYESASTTMPVELAHLLYRLSETHLAAGNELDGAMLLRGALDRIDATGMDARRARIEQRLREEFPQVWMLHAAGRFIGQEQIDRFLEQAGHSGFRGETKEMTILFSDIRGFTGLSESMPPDRLVKVLNDYFTRMTRCIEYFGGVVDKFNGDAIMAIFPQPERAVACGQALRAALLMRAELNFFNLEYEEVRIEIGIGVNAGPVVSGLIGSPQKRSYTVIGDTVNTASRLEGMTRQLGAGILLSEEVEHAADTAGMLLRPLGKFSPKGRKQAVMVYDLLGQVDCIVDSVDLLREVGGCRSFCDNLYNDRVEPAMEDLERLAETTGDSYRREGYRFIHRLIGDIVKENGGEELREGFALNRK